ncbi:MAG: SPASM domain-containing protein [Planctomycetes bacterium]|nr:SPASM domain-containing protein [Planctomycetota bacterium]
MKELAPDAAERRLEELIHQTAELRRQRGLPAVGRRLFHLQLDTTNLCNLQCKECSVHLIRDVVHPRVMTRATLGIVADQVFPYAGDVNFAALAEPWMSPVLEEAIAIARAAGVPFLQMISNALLLTERRARKLIAVQFDRLSVSTDAATPETYRRVRGAHFARVIRNLERLRDLKVQLGARKPVLKFNFVMLRTNLHEMPAMVDLAHELGAEMIDFRLPFLLARQGMDGELPTRAPELMDEMILKTRARMAARGLAIEQLPETNAERRARGYRTPGVQARPGPRADATPHCDAPWGFLVIGPTGDVHPCCSPYMLAAPALGNLTRRTFAQILTGPRYEQLRRSLVAGAFGAECARCKATDFLDVYELDPAHYVATGPRLPITGVEEDRRTRAPGP